VVLVNTT